MICVTYDIKLTFKNDVKTERLFVTPARPRTYSSNHLSTAQYGTRMRLYKDYLAQHNSNVSMGSVNY